MIDGWLKIVVVEAVEVLTGLMIRLICLMTGLVICLVTRRMTGLLASLMSSLMARLLIGLMISLVTGLVRGGRFVMQLLKRGTVMAVRRAIVLDERLFVQ